MEMTKRIIILWTAILLSAPWAMAQAGIHWQCNIYEFQYDMTLYFTLENDDAVVSDLADYEVAAFVGNECRGVGSIETVTPSGGGSVKYGYLRIRSNVTEGDEVSFKVYHIPSGNVYRIPQTVPFAADGKTGLPSSPYMLSFTKVLMGDANGDQKVNVNDVVTTVNHILERENDVFVLEAADVNGDNLINVTDVVGIVNIILGRTP